MLTDIGNLLTFQVTSGLNTYVVDNPILCFSSSIIWGRLPQSLIHYHISAVCREQAALIVTAIYCCDFASKVGNLTHTAQCSSYPCQLFVLGDVCSSTCPICGVLCEAFPITDLPSLQLYSAQKCNIVAGDLYIMSLAYAIRKAVLFLHLKTVWEIRGSVFILNNQFRTALTFFQNLLTVNNIYLLNNPALLDARFAGLVTLTGNVTVIGCDRLCPERYPSLSMSTNQSECADPYLQHFFSIVGPATAGDVPLIAQLLTAAFLNTTGAGNVCCHSSDCIWPHKCVSVCRRARCQRY